MEYTNKDMSEFIMNVVNMNNKPLKFWELNTITIMQLLKKGYAVIVKEDKKSLCSLFYSVVSPPKRSVIKDIKEETMWKIKK